MDVADEGSRFPQTWSGCLCQEAKFTRSVHPRYNRRIYSQLDTATRKVSVSRLAENDFRKSNASHDSIVQGRRHPDAMAIECHFDATIVEETYTNGVLFWGEHKRLGILLLQHAQQNEYTGLSRDSGVVIPEIEVGWDDRFPVCKRYLFVPRDRRVYLPWSLSFENEYCLLFFTPKPIHGILSNSTQLAMMLSASEASLNSDIWAKMVLRKTRSDWLREVTQRRWLGRTFSACLCRLHEKTFFLPTAND